MIELLRKSLSLIIVLSILISCTIFPPEIREHDWSITLVHDLERDFIYESLSVFLNCYDEDGENDIETIYLIDDKDGIYWQLTQDNWEYRYIDDIKWIGSSNIIMPDRSKLPRTSLRIYVRDRAGESVEDKLYISQNSIDPDKTKFPDLVIDNSNYSISGYEAGDLILIVDNRVIAKGQITKTPASLEDIFKIDISEYNDFKLSLQVEAGDYFIRNGPWY